ncbi:MAG: NAD(P)H-dependent oxidoreductase [Actinomycetes bacterium]|jgi:FMN reductase|nr:NADPH-dependent FMN reductase [Acidimicrobiia bacterium]
MDRKPVTVAVVTAGLRQPSSTRRLAEQLAEAAAAALARRGVEATVEMVELRDIAHDMIDHLLEGQTSPELRKAIDEVTRADGIIAVTPIFSASYNGLFKNFFDVLDPDSLAGKPVLIGATAGTPRHSLALEHAIRPLFTFLRAVVAPTAVFAASEDWDEDRQPMISERIRRAADEFAHFVFARASAEAAVTRN